MSRSVSWRWPLIVSFLRLPLYVGVGAVALWCLRLAGVPWGFAHLAGYSSLIFIVVNVISLVVIDRILAAEGTSIAALIGFERTRLGRDILWGLVWQFLLFIPFIGAILVAMSIVFGPDLFQHFETVFAPPPNAEFQLSRGVSLVAALLAATLFPLTNAPTEEIFYRGYAQDRLHRLTGKPWIAVLLPAVGFALQHTVLAATAVGAVVYGLGFLAWGLGAGIVFHRRKRLMPLIVAHLMTNFVFGLIPLVLLLAS